MALYRPVLGLLVGIFAFLLAGCGNVSVESTRAHEGVIDLRGVLTDSDGPVALDGEWRWTRAAAADDAQITGVPHASDEPAFIELPVSLIPERSQGRGILELSLLLPKRAGFWALKIPYLASANRVEVNGQQIGGAGSVQPYQARYHPLELLFEAPEGRAEITIHVANFHHRRMRLNRLYVGRADEIIAYSMISVTRDALILGSLLFLAFYHLAVFVMYRQETALGYLAAIALLAAMRLSITGERLIVRIWPLISPELMMKIGYAPTFLLLPLIVLYLRSLSSDRALFHLGRIAGWYVVITTLVIVVFPVSVYDAVFQYGIGIILLLALAVMVTVLRRHVFDSPQGRMVVLAGGVLVLAAGVSDYLRETGALVAPELLSLGVLLFLLLQAYFLAWRIHTLYQRTEEQASTIHELNRTLEERISMRTAELADANRQLEAMSRTDGLTGLANRRHFDGAFQREWDRAQRSDVPIALIMTDIDRFKMYNDTHGHLRGDECLKEVAQVYAEAARRKTDVVARYGGEEFVLLLPDTDRATAAAIAETSRRRIMERHIIHESSNVAAIVTASFGVAATVPEPNSVPADLLKKADTALYRAKTEGRNRVIVSQE
ncbi:MAG TPA: diguanylate cyclase [Alkalispirochaeta sp.]|nr:diguanylate cyclase [Alkalispirochaeta sp.]